jgi:hypothetical protein
MSIQSPTSVGSNKRLARGEIYKVCEAGYNEIANASAALRPK